MKPQISYDDFDKIDIKKAIGCLNKTNQYSNSQGVVVRNNKIIAIEGKGGTEKLLQKCKKKTILKSTMHFLVELCLLNSKI